MPGLSFVRQLLCIGQYPKCTKPSAIHVTAVVRNSGYTHPVQQQQQQQQPLQQQPNSGWQLFFNPHNWSPAPSFIELISAIFAHLDTSCVGYLTPEAYSAYLDTAGYPTVENIWKNALPPAHRALR